MRYWQYVRWRAYCEARDYVRDHFGRAMTFVAVSIAAVAAVRYYGAEGEWWNDLIAVAVWVGAMALVFGYLFVIRMFSVPVRMRRAALGACRQARAEAAEARAKYAALTVSPKAIPIAELAAIAESAGWNFKGPYNGHFFDFSNAMRLAAYRGQFEIEGVPGIIHEPEDRRINYLPDPIPREYYKDFHFDVPGYFTEPVRNYDISTYSWKDHTEKLRFRDLCITNREKALAWLATEAEEWKGRQMESETMRRDRRAKLEADMRAQGFVFEGDEDSEQGRRAIKPSNDAQEG
jgi:hypothetical protein